MTTPTTTTTRAFALRAIRPELSRRDALGIVRLPAARIAQLRRRRLLDVGQARSTARSLRILGEIA